MQQESSSEGCNLSNQFPDHYDSCHIILASRVLIPNSIESHVVGNWSFCEVIYLLSARLNACYKKLAICGLIIMIEVGHVVYFGHFRKLC